MNLPNIHNVSFDIYNIQWVPVLRGFEVLWSPPISLNYHHLGLKYIGIDSTRTIPYHIFQITDTKKWIFARLKYSL